MNRVMIIGNLTRDPESRTTNTGKEVCNFTVAVNRRQRDADGNSIADFFKVAAWNELGKSCQQYLAKGRKVAVVGSVSVSTFEGQDGTTRASLEVLAQEVEFLTPRNQDGSGGASTANSMDSANAAVSNPPAPTASSFASAATQANLADDELPF